MKRMRVHETRPDMGRASQRFLFYLQFLLFFHASVCIQNPVVIARTTRRRGIVNI
jgi:hypothetical protein